MSDGQILRNSGHGFKLYKKWNPGVDVVAATARIAAIHSHREVTMPTWCAYRRSMISTCCVSLRWKMEATIELMPNDADGVWSTMDDFNHHFDIGEIVALCAVYRAWKAVEAAETQAHADYRKTFPSVAA